MRWAKIVIGVTLFEVGCAMAAYGVTNPDELSGAAVFMLYINGILAVCAGAAIAVWAAVNNRA